MPAPNTCCNKCLQVLVCFPSGESLYCNDRGCHCHDKQNVPKKDPSKKARPHPLDYLRAMDEDQRDQLADIIARTQGSLREAGTQDPDFATGYILGLGMGWSVRRGPSPLPEEHRCSKCQTAAKVINGRVSFVCPGCRQREWCDSNCKACKGRKRKTKKPRRKA